MAYKKFKTKMEIEAVDLDEMERMTLSDYKEYIKFGLTLIDHHDNLRSGPAGYPLACTKAQLSALIDYLGSIKNQLSD